MQDSVKLRIVEGYISIHYLGFFFFVLLFFFFVVGGGGGLQ